MSHNQDIYDHYVALARLYADQAEWLWVKNDWLSYVGGNRKKDPRSGKCVYFLTHENHHGLVKVGLTNNVRDRFRAIKSQYGSEPSVIALAKTCHYKQFEFVLHQIFDPWRVEGEWFDARILSWVWATKRRLAVAS